MAYFKNVELASRYNIAESTVRNWIKMAERGKLGLTLSYEGERPHVANIPSNIWIITKLVETNRKYRNSLSTKLVIPKARFYKVFSPTQVYDIIRNLEIHREVPRQYNFFENGADEWDRYMKQLVSQGLPSVINGTIQLLSENQNYIERQMAKYKKVNVVDVGIGNAQPSRDVLGHLLAQGKLGRYIAIDISPRMLKIAEQNVREWFGDKVAFEAHQLDITHERFAHLLADDYMKGDSCNLVLFLGAVPTNFRVPGDAFRVLNESMGPNDLLVCTDKLECDSSKPEWFDHDHKGGSPQRLKLSPRHRPVFDLLNIDESFYDVEMGIEGKTGERYARVRLKVALTIQFGLDDLERSVSLEKGDTILIWRAWQMTSLEMAERLDLAGFYTPHSSQTDDQNYLLTISRVKRDS